MRKVIVSILLCFMVVFTTAATYLSRPPGSIKWVTDYGAKGDGVTDDTTFIQAALDDLVSGDTLLFPRGTYMITDQLELDGDGVGIDGIALKGSGGGAGSMIQWNTAADPNKTILRISWVSYSRIENLRFYGGPTNNPGYAVWVTSRGAGAPNTTTMNIFELCHFQKGSKGGLRFGSETNVDVTLDQNVVRNCQARYNGSGVIVSNNNCNNTRIESCALSDNTISGIEAELGTRCVNVHNCQFSANGGQHILIDLCLSMSLWDHVQELQDDIPFITATAASQRECNLSIQNLFVTNNNADNIKIIDYQQNGVITMTNCHIAGNGDPVVAGTTGQIYVSGNGSAQNGGRMLITNGVHLHSGAHFTVVQTGASPFRWINNGLSYQTTNLAFAGPLQRWVYSDGDSVSHDYAAGTTAWTMTEAEACGRLFTVTNAGGAANAVFPKAVAGKQFTVYNNSGAAITFKVTGQAGSAVATGKYAVFTMNATDCIEIYEQP